MPRVIINMQNFLLGDAVEQALAKYGDFQVSVVEKPQDVVNKCASFVPNILMMQVNGFTPWKLEERLKLLSEVKQLDASCKVVILVDENAEEGVANEVKQAKKDGLIDLFAYGSTSASYLAALMETL